jgi:hypothetical protein
VPFVDFAGAGLSRVLSKMFMIMLLLPSDRPEKSPTRAH